MIHKCRSMDEKQDFLNLNVAFLRRVSNPQQRGYSPYENIIKHATNWAVLFIIYFNLINSSDLQNHLLISF